MPGYKSLVNISPAIVTATTTMQVLIGPVDISLFDKFCLQYQNDHTAIGFRDMHVQASIVSAGSAVDVAPHWVEINTTTLPAPSGLAATASVLTSAVDNCYHWLRIIGWTSQTMAAGLFKVNIGGFTRFY